MNETTGSPNAGSVEHLVSRLREKYTLCKPCWVDNTPDAQTVWFKVGGDGGVPRRSELRRMTLYWFYLENLPFYERPEFKRLVWGMYFDALNASLKRREELASGGTKWDENLGSVFREARYYPCEAPSTNAFGRRRSPSSRA